jgi:ABC-type glycerol-3-phosphate transport system substrate-binding protein
MKNFFKLGFVALALSLSVVACNSEKTAETTDTLSSDTTVTVDTNAVDTTVTTVTTDTTVKTN